MKKLLLALAIITLSHPSFAQHFIENQAYREQMQKDFQLRKAHVPTFNGTLTPEETEALEFLYAYMPLSDWADYNSDFFLQQVRSAFEARDFFPWGKEIPEEIFRHFVLIYRVNNENLDNSRQVFFDELKDRIIGMSMYDAALEVNHWCHEKVAYQPSDARTSSPLATIRSAHGRCGEESTLLVTALRAVGIPARQCYTPRWAHTDDNHAWVEVWVDGQWYFLGACEPDPELNMGWFAFPSTRTMMVHTNVFGKYNGTEDVTYQTDYSSRINLLPNYADTKKITISVVDGQGTPLPNVTVKFKLYNYAEYYPIAQQKTDAKGEAVLTTGLGDLLIWATDGKQFGYQKIDVREQTELTIVMDQSAGKEYVEELTIVPPYGKENIVTADEEKVAINQKRLHYEDSIRTDYMSTFKTEYDAKFIKNKNLTKQQIGFYLKKAEGNYAEVENLLKWNAKKEANFHLNELLQSLSDKDFRDLQAAVIQAHKTYYDSTKYPFDVYVKGIISPRISNEGLRPWRSFLHEKMLKELNGKVSVQNIQSWVQENINIDNDGNYFGCPISPEGVYGLRRADRHSRNIFFVAVCRALDIPAYLDNATYQLYAYENGKWQTVNFDQQDNVKHNSIQTAKLTVNYAGKDDFKPAYYSHYTIEKYENGDYVSLDFENDSRVDSLPFTLELESGHYLLSTGRRYNDGTVLSRLDFFELKPNDNLHKNLVFKDLTIQNRNLGKLTTQHISFGKTAYFNKDFNWKADNGKMMLFCFLDPTREPTKHLLKDLSDKKVEFEKLSSQLDIVLESEKPCPDFNLEQWNLPSQIVFRNYDAAGTRLMKEVLPPQITAGLNSNYPLVVLVGEDGSILFVSKGYNIGTPDLILQEVMK